MKQVPVPILENRTYTDFYCQAVRLARLLCPEWRNGPENSADPGAVLIRIFVRLAEMLAQRINRIPEKYRLAFYDLLEFEYLPAVPARAPLTFTLKPDFREAVAPARTQVTSNIDSSVILETVEAFTPIRFTIQAAYSLDPRTDRYTDLSPALPGSGNGFYLFGMGGSLTKELLTQPIPHLLYLADPVFALSASLEFDISFDFETPPAGTLSDYVTGCRDGTGRELPGEITETVKLYRQFVPETVVDGKADYWLGLTLTPAWMEKGAAPIKNMKYKASSGQILPDALLSNSTALELIKGYDPFGSEPQIGDGFYIGSREAFAVPGATISLTVRLRGGVASQDQSKKTLLGLAWQFWDGSVWQKFDVVADETEKFTVSSYNAATDEDQPKKISFTLPQAPTLTEMAGITSRWIRVLLVNGGYGGPGSYQTTNLRESLADPTDENYNNLVLLLKKNITFGVEYIASSFMAPHIYSLILEYSIANRVASRIKAYNNFRFIAPPAGQLFNPYQPSPERLPGCYLGFAEDCRNQPLQLYFSVAPQKATQDDSGAYAHYRWQYSVDTGWKDLEANDETGDFLHSGLVRMKIPADIAPRPEFGRTTSLYWLRIMPRDRSVPEGPAVIIKGIFPNTVWAEQAVQVRDELLGSSNGEAGQEFITAHGLILPGQIIEIREAGVPPEPELRAIRARLGDGALRLVRNDTGDITEVWVKWLEVNNWANSGPASRHYQIDREQGRISFGDGKFGMIPPAASQNILACEYRYGGGVAWDQPARSLTMLNQKLEGIEQVVNYDPAQGGAAAETIAEFLKRAPYSLKSRERAVTVDDFAWLAEEVATEITQARCFEEMTQQRIRVVIATDPDRDYLTPDHFLLEKVAKYLKQQVFVTLQNHIIVVYPAYREINVTLSLSETWDDRQFISDHVIEALRRFFHAVDGGPDQAGWQLGQSIMMLDVIAAVENASARGAVLAISISKAGMAQRVARGGVNPDTGIMMCHDELPYPGEVTINFGEES